MPNSRNESVTPHSFYSLPNHNRKAQYKSLRCAIRNLHIKKQRVKFLKCTSEGITTKREPNNIRVPLTNARTIYVSLITFTSKLRQVLNPQLHYSLVNNYQHFTKPFTHFILTVKPQELDKHQLNIDNRHEI